MAGSFPGGNGVLECWEGFFAAEFSGHTRTIAYQEARQEVARVIQDFTLTDVQLPEFGWVCALLDALAACKLGRAVGPDAVPVEFIRAAGIFYLRLVAEVCKAAAATGVPFWWREG